MSKDYYILKAVDSKLTAFMEYKDHIDVLNKNKITRVWDFFTDDSKYEILIESKHGAEFIHYVPVYELTEEIIDRSDEINYEGELSKDVLKMIMKENNNEQGF